jgi:hydrogenase nickel incorporation protein HypA/HybF
MHELSIAQGICRTVLRHVPTGKRAVSVVVEAGPLCGVVQEALEFGFEIASQAMGLGGAKLDYRILAAPGSCPACQARFDVTEMWARCPRCQHEPVTVEGGSELRLKEIEVDDV